MQRVEGGKLFEEGVDQLRRWCLPALAEHVVPVPHGRVYIVQARAFELGEKLLSDGL